MDASTERQAQKFIHSDTIEDVNRDLPLDIPDIFDGRQVWSKYLSPVVDQGNCGACWAFATSSALADRMAIQTLGQLKIDLSPAKMILCNWGAKDQAAYVVLTQKLKSIIENNIKTKVACNGNSIQQALTYLYKFGTSDTTCVPYDLGVFPDLEHIKDEKLPVCQTVVGDKFDKCLTGQPMRVYRVNSSYTLKPASGDTDYLRIKYDIYRWGPIVSGFLLYPDFYTYNPKTDGVYSPQPNQQYTGGHAIEIVGWGQDGSSGLAYWWVKNSWGTKWGLDGYFKCQMGNPMLEIEKNAMGCVPDIPGVDEGYNSPRFIQETDQDKYDRGEFRVHESGYPYTIVNDVRNKKMFGVDISPIVQVGKLPDMDTFVAGRVTTGDYVGSVTNYQEAPVIFTKPRNVKTSSIEMYKTPPGNTSHNHPYMVRNIDSINDRPKAKRVRDIRWLVLGTVLSIFTFIHWYLNRRVQLT
jgi:hypothetical protein